MVVLLGNTGLLNLLLLQNLRAENIVLAVVTVIVFKLPMERRRAPQRIFPDFPEEWEGAICGR